MDAGVDVGAALEGIQAALLQFAIPLAGTSALTVALLEAAKKLFSLRGLFHKQAVLRWLSEVEGGQISLWRGARVLEALHGSAHYSVPRHATTRRVEGALSAVKTALGPEVVEYSYLRAYAELQHLVTGLALDEEQQQPLDTILAPNPKTLRPQNARFRGVDQALFELETGRMMSQVQDAADAVLNNPGRYPHLFQFLSRGCSVADLRQWANYLASVPAGSAAGEGDASRLNKEGAEVYTRIRLLVRRQLDAFQSVTQLRWEELNQLWAVIVGASILWVAQVLALDHVWGASLGQHVRMLAQAMLGGVLAPIAKDLVSALSNLRFR